uniref:Uncharacterized protein n=1 Tax=Aegilops tauschii subsp. strangulata TaxID=200361 RepID=A0A453PMM0_AEGTS
MCTIPSSQLCVNPTKFAFLLAYRVKWQKHIGASSRCIFSSIFLLAYFQCAFAIYRGNAFQDRNNIIKSLKGKIMKLALSDYVCLFVVCLLSIVDNTKLVTEIIIEELTKQLKELTFDKDEASVNLDNVTDKEHEDS